MESDKPEGDCKLRRSRSRSFFRKKSETKDVFSKEASELRKYKVIHVKDYDGKPYDEALKIVEEVDKLNQEIYKRSLSLLHEIEKLKKLANDLVDGATNTQTIPSPPDYKAELEEHRTRNRYDNIRWQTVCTQYLQLKGFLVWDTTLYKPTVIDTTIDTEMIIEPYQVIQKATELSKESHENIEEIIVKPENRKKIMGSHQIFASSQHQTKTDSRSRSHDSNYSHSQHHRMSQHERHSQPPSHPPPQLPPQLPQTQLVYPNLELESRWKVNSN